MSVTVLVAAKCSDGIVVGADSRATSAVGSQSLMSVPSEDKIKIIDGKIIIAGTGSVGLGQRFNFIVEQLHAAGVISAQPCLSSCKVIAASAIQDFTSTGIQCRPSIGYGFGALLAAPMPDEGELVEFSLPDFQPERKLGKLHYVSMGSGQILADPFLAFVSRVLRNKKEPSVQLAKLGLHWALSHSIAFAPGGVGGPIQMATLQKELGGWKASLLLEDELGELEQHIGEIETRIVSYPTDIIKQAEVVPPPAPPTEAPS